MRHLQVLFRHFVPKNSNFPSRSASNNLRPFLGAVKNHSLTFQKEVTVAVKSLRSCDIWKYHTIRRFHSSVANSSHAESALRSNRKKLPKGSLKTMEISEDLLQQIITPEIETLASLFDKYGYELRMAGGAVRDLISGKLPADIDFATTATPDEMKQMFETEQIRMINMKGEKHGTITARINDKENFEVTTLRIDVVTDGRHAEVEFTKNWELDAARRDLTINSMFMDLKGKVYDYFDGAEDLKAKRVKFVGDPVQRIQEDYLRILRYFRFHGRISEKADDHEEKTLEAIKNNMSGLKQISGERLWVELKKILSGNFSEELMVKMLDLGISPFIGLPDDYDKAEFQALCTRTKAKNMQLNPIALMTGLLKTEQHGSELHKRLKLSAFERDLCLFLILYRNTLGKEMTIVPMQKVVIFSSSSTAVVRLWVEEVYKYNANQELLEEFQQWNLPKFPVSGHLLVERKVPGGKAMTRVMMALKELWVESGFTTTSEDLLAHLPQILKVAITQPDKSKVKKK